MIKNLLALATTVLAAVAVQAQEITYVKAGRLVDVVDGRLRSDQVIEVSGSRIARVGSNIEIPDGARVR